VIHRRWGGSASALAVLAALITLLASCKQGPNFFSPAPPQETAYTAPGDPIPPTTDTSAKNRAAQRIAVGAKVAADWWTLFHSPALNGTVNQALRDSPTIAQAEAQLAQAREVVRAALGAAYPQVDVSVIAGRQAVDVAPNGLNRGPAPVNIYGVGPTVAYTPDVFGAIARNVEAQSALADLSDYQVAAAYLALSGNIATQAIAIAGLRAQIKTVGDILANDEQNLKLVKTQQAGGTATMVDVTTAQTQLANDRTLLPPLRQQLSVARDALAVYVGRTPADWSPPDFDLATLTLPSVVPVSLPSAMVRQRPDILAAEAQLHANAALVGVAIANLFPKFTLAASINQEAIEINNFFSALYNGWAVTGGLTAPMFHGGTLEAQKRGAIDAFNASWAAYRQVVLQAFGQVADQLQALAHDDEAVKSQRAALASANQALKLARLSYEGGNSTLLQLLDPQRQLEQAQLGVVRAETQRLTDTAQLLVALGSGWWNTPPAEPGPQADVHDVVPASPTATPAPPPTGAENAGPFWDRWFKGGE
jgi:NodT family efflux transporter outer membrane factor (OMF) lipoprotein